MALFVPRAWLPYGGRGLAPSPAPTPRGVIATTVHSMG